MSGPRYSILPADALDDPRIRDGHLRVLAILGSHTDKNGWCEINQKTIAARAGKSRETINRIIRDLCEEGYLDKIDRWSKSDGRTISKYQVIMDRPEKAEHPCDPDVTTPVTPEDHNPCDLQTSQHNDPFFNDQSSLRSDKRTPRDELENVLDAERAAAVIEHRRTIRKPLTAHAARILARKFACSPNPNAAADTMIGNGWQGFDVAWLRDRGKATAPPERSVSDVLCEIAAGTWTGPKGNDLESHRPPIETSFVRRN